MERIFISSLARRQMGAIRQAARRAVEALDMHPVMFETGAASDEASRRTLLDRVVGPDALILLLGAEYGEPLSRGISPTEEEFNEARERWHEGVPSGGRLTLLVEGVPQVRSSRDDRRRLRCPPRPDHLRRA